MFSVQGRYKRPTFYKGYLCHVLNKIFITMNSPNIISITITLVCLSISSCQKADLSSSSNKKLILGKWNMITSTSIYLSQGQYKTEIDPFKSSSWTSFDDKGNVIQYSAFNSGGVFVESRALYSIYDNKIIFKTNATQSDTLNIDLLTKNSLKISNSEDNWRLIIDYTK
jgi:hypothetical protein